jgi:hypothetical protein
MEARTNYFFVALALGVTASASEVRACYVQNRN